MKDEIVELQVYIFTWLCIYFCMFFLSVKFELGGVAVVHCLPKKKKKKKKCSVSEFTNISGMAELNNTPCNLLYPLK